MASPGAKPHRKHQSSPQSSPPPAKTAAALPDAVEKGSPVSGGSALDSEEIARLAYSYWEARGCQGGSPEDDWLRAERELQSQR